MGSCCSSPASDKDLEGGQILSGLNPSSKISNSGQPLQQQQQQQQQQQKQIENAMNTSDLKSSRNNPMMIIDQQNSDYTSRGGTSMAAAAPAGALTAAGSVTISSDKHLHNSGSLNNPHGNHAAGANAFGGSQSPHHFNNNNGNNTPSQNRHKEGSMIYESTSLNGFKPAHIPSKDVIGSRLAIEEIISSHNRVESLERDEQQYSSIDGSVGKYVVRSKEQLTNSETAKFLFLCTTDSAKSFIVQLQRKQAALAGSTQMLFDIANKYVHIMYGTDALGVDLLFGSVNLSQPATMYSDCFPAYFKTKEIFEEPYKITITLPSKQQQQVMSSPTQNQQLQQQQLLQQPAIAMQVTPSMTVEDAKKELLKIDASLNINSCALIMLRNQSFPSPAPFSSYRRHTIFTAQQACVALLDEEKFGLIGQNYPSDQFALVNEAEETKESQGLFIWPANSNGGAAGASLNSTATSAAAATTGSASASIGGEVKLDVELIKAINESQLRNRRVKPGVNVEFVCKQLNCPLNGGAAVLWLGVGVFDFSEKAAQRLVKCSHCSSDKSIVIQNIALNRCRFAFTAVHSDSTKRTSPKWAVAFQPHVVRKLDYREFEQRSNNKSSGIQSTSWSAVLADTQWKTFRVYAKIIAHSMRIDDNEEFFLRLQLEDGSSHRMCGVCKLNVADQMQHTLACGHSYHKICLNLLPTIFASISCPLCYK